MLLTQVIGNIDVTQEDSERGQNTASVVSDLRVVLWYTRLKIYFSFYLSS